MRRRLSSHFHWLRTAAKAKVDVVAQQLLDHDDGIFGAVCANDLDAVLRFIDSDENCLALRDSVGAAPVHIAFLFGHYELGKRIVLRCRALASLTYMSSDIHEPSPYEGENILHIAIIHRQTELVQWLVQKTPQLIRAETTGEFFRPTKACYFGGTPLLFALASNQIDMALHILEAAEKLQDGPFKEDEEEAMASIFTCDAHGNNILHLAVIRDLPGVYDFALRYVMRLLSPSKDKFTPIKAGSITPEKKPGGELHEVETMVVVQKPSRTLSPTEELLPAPDDLRQGEINLVEFLKSTTDSGYEQMLRFLMQRNSDELTPLSLAAAIGQQRMFQHLFNHSSSIAWRYGPITAIHVPLFDLEQPELRPDPDFGRFQRIHDMVASLPYPLAPKGRRGYRTAIQCLCSTEKISNTIEEHHTVMQEVVSKRLEMLKMLEIQQLLNKKWKYVGKRRFLLRLAVYSVFLVLLNSTTLTPYSNYTDGSRAKAAGLGFAEVGANALAAVKFLNESNQILLSFHGYVSEGGAGRLDNICTIVTSISLFVSSTARLAHQQEVGDAFGAVALIFAWFYMFFFLLGFRTTGPFVIMILRMIANDIVRFFFVYGAVLAGFTQAIYVVHDGRVGPHALFVRMRALLVMGFTGEVNYDDNYGSGGRMNAFTQVLVLCYVVLVMIILVNLLIAMMGNTYSEVLEESEQRWVAERANIMAAIDNQCPTEWNQQARKSFAIPLQNRSGEEMLYHEMEVTKLEEWMHGSE
ncbi:Transient receptor potential cation channel subfamily V member 1 [Phytophthora citrophthora]|uniref:Transient receptor potential cation channel subfamily V member 1 n=1 Tax=Phytophthora citrophthora TaxID=4793 RepID=A0AAD9G466_9STRA|nr:Transient receptor potential cation channel subfamily V member 1 [Phytophthora citrophthora]